MSDPATEPSGTLPPQKTEPTPISELGERLAAIEHARWAHWMRYLFTKGTRNQDGSFTIEAGSVAHWDRQVAAPYAELSEREKESDRKEARKTLAVVGDLEQTIRSRETVLREVADLSDEQSAAVLAQVEAAMTEANRQGGNLHRVWALLAPALETLRKGRTQ